MTIDEAAGAFVVVLHYGDLSGIQKIWGPYPDESTAEAAQAVLEEWPMFGAWSIESVAAFPIASPPVAGDGRD